MMNSDISGCSDMSGNSKLFPSVENYLNTLDLNDNLYAFLGVDKRNVIFCSGGAIEDFGLENIATGSVASEHLSYLEGLIPFDDKPVVIENTQFISERYVDIHLLTDKEFQWVVFIDNTEAGKVLQRTQQEQLNSDIENEKRDR